MKFDVDKYSDEYNMFMRDMRSKARMPPRTGGMTSFPGLFIYTVARQLGARKILEVGTRNGVSACTFARAMKENHGEGVLITCDIVDVRKGEGRPVDAANVFPQTPDKMVKAISAGCVDVHFLVERGASVLRQTPDRCLDVILLDGSHKEDDVYEEIPLALDKLRDGGVLLLDDVYPDEKQLKHHHKVIPGPWRALKRLLDEGTVSDYFQPDPNYSVAWLPCSR